MLGELIKARTAYERALIGGRTLPNSMVERLADRDLEFSGHVFVVNSADRRIQITIDNVEEISVFIKETGVYDEVKLLQIIVSLDDLQISTCIKLFNLWIIDKVPIKDIELLIDQPHH